MANVISSPEDVINASLGRIGYPLRIGSIFDGSEAAKAALDIYGQTRDEMMRDGEWEFVERNLNAVLLKMAPAGGYFVPWDPVNNPPVPWAYEYAYPEDCLKVRNVRTAPIFLVEVDPQPSLFSIYNDNAYTPARRTVLSNTANAILVYAGRVTDPLTWPVGFTEALIAALARRLAPHLATSPDAVKMEALDEAQQVAASEPKSG